MSYNAWWPISSSGATQFHESVLKKFHSVPFKFVGRDVRVRVTTKLIEIFDEDNYCLLLYHQLGPPVLPPTRLHQEVHLRLG
jgi:hypothetical protein